jgi:hypothetical protein
MLLAILLIHRYMIIYGVQVYPILYVSTEICPGPTLIVVGSQWTVWIHTGSWEDRGSMCARHTKRDLVWDTALTLSRDRELFTLQEVMANIERSVSRQTTHDVLSTMADMGYLEKDDRPTGVWQEAPSRRRRRRKATQESIVRATVM